MPVKAIDDGLLEIDGGLDGAAGDEKHLHDGADEACPAGEVLELVLDVLPGRIAAWSAPRAASSLPEKWNYCLLYTSPSPRDRQKSRMPSSA